MRKDNYKVYLIRENSSGDIKYVGLTRRTIKERFDDHVIRFKIKRYEYTPELIVENLTIEAAAELEKMLINQYNLLNTGWNSSPGSINGFSNYHSDKQKLIWSKTRKNKPVSKEHAEKNRIARLGKKNSKEHTEKLLQSIKKPVMCIETGIIYDSARQAAKNLGLNYSKISDVCNGKRKTTGNLHFKFIQKKQ